MVSWHKRGQSSSMQNVMIGKILGLNNQLNISYIFDHTTHVSFRTKYKVQAYWKLWHPDNILQIYGT